MKTTGCSEVSDKTDVANKFKEELKILPSASNKAISIELPQEIIPDKFELNPPEILEERNIEELVEDDSNKAADSGEEWIGDEGVGSTIQY